MLLTPLCRALALAGCLLLALPAWSADATTNAKKEPPVPSSSRAEGGAATDRAARALIDAGRFGDALALLGPRLQGERVEPNVLFLYGLASVEASQQPNVPDNVRDRLLDEAIGAFRIMLFNEPGLVRVRLELARAFFLKGEDDLSRRHFELVLAGNPPAQVVGNVRAFLNRMRARRRWSFNLGFALAPDSNIGASSDERTIYIFDLPFQRDQQELTTSGLGVSLWGGAEYQIPLGDTTRLRAGGQFARREYERSQFDQFFLGGHLGPRWLLNRSTEVSLLASARQRWLGTVKDDHSLGARVEAAHRFSPAVTVSGQASWHGRRYRTRTRLDGPVLDTSLRGTWVVTPTLRANLSGGYGRERPRSLQWRHRSRWLGAGVEVILPLGFTVGGGGEVRWADYQGNWFPNVRDGSPRGDRTRILRVSVHNRGFTLYGFSPQIVLVQEKRTSNAQLYDFQRTRGELRFVQQF